MIDPANITNFKLDQNGLEEHIVFWICVAGKTAKTIAKSLDGFWNEVGGENPFKAVAKLGEKKLVKLLKKHGIGCYTNKARSLYELAIANFDLKTCSVDQLESVFGIGPKTARCFLIHTRPNVRYSGIDTHVLKFLRDLGHSTPKSTPTGRKYKEMENLFLNYVDKSNKTVSEFDLAVWNAYSSTKNPLFTLKQSGLIC